MVSKGNLLPQNVFLAASHTLSYVSYAWRILTNEFCPLYLWNTSRG